MTDKLDFSDLKDPKPAKGDFSDLAEKKPRMVKTFLGDMPAPEDFKREMESPEAINEMMINLLPAARGMKLIGEAGPSLAKSIKSVFTKIAPRSWVESVQKGHDIMKSKAEDMFNFIKDQIPSRNIPSMKISPKLLKEAEDHLPNTRATKTLIQNARNGDYESVHRLQSSLGKKGFGRLASDDPAQWDIGEEIIDTRDKLLENIKNHFDKTGNSDLSDILNNARIQWKNLKDIYYKHPKIAQMVEQDTRLVPKNPENIFSEESVPMKRVLEQHPEIGQQLDTMNTANRFINSLKRKGSIGLGIGGVGGSLYTGSKIMDYFRDLNQQNQQ